MFFHAIETAIGCEKIFFFLSLNLSKRAYFYQELIFKMKKKINEEKENKLPKFKKFSEISGGKKLKEESIAPIETEDDDEFDTPDKEPTKAELKKTKGLAKAKDELALLVKLFKICLSYNSILKA
jgi:hypothetical protein